MAKITFNKMIDYPRTSVLNVDLDKFINGRKETFKNIPIRYKGTWFEADGSFERDQEDIIISDIFIDDEELDFSDEELKKIKDLIVQMIVDYDDMMERGMFDV